MESAPSYGGTPGSGGIQALTSNVNANCLVGITCSTLATKIDEPKSGAEIGLNGYVKTKMPW